MKKLILLTMLFIVATPIRPLDPQNYKQALLQYELLYQDIILDLDNNRNPGPLFDRMKLLLRDFIKFIQIKDITLPLRKTALERIQLIVKKLINKDQLTAGDEVIMGQLATMNAQLIKDNFFQNSPNDLAAFLSMMIDFYLDTNNTDRALQYINFTKDLNAQSTITPRYLKMAYDKQYAQANRLLNGDRVPQDKERAQRLLIEVINGVSTATRDTVKQAYEALFELFFEKLEGQTTEEQLDVMNDVFNKVIDGTYKATQEYFNKVQLNQINIAIAYASPAINNKEKARTILEAVLHNKNSSAKNKTHATELLKTL